MKRKMSFIENVSTAILIATCVVAVAIIVYCCVTGSRVNALKENQTTVMMSATDSISVARTKPTTEESIEVTVSENTEVPTEAPTEATEVPETTEATEVELTEPPTEAPTTGREDAWFPDYTDDDVTYLGNVIYREVGGYISTLPRSMALHAYELTGSVVLHRLEVSYRGATTLWEVVNSPSQYACKDTVGLEWGRVGVPECYEVAEQLLRGGPIGPRNLLGQSGHVSGEIYEIIDDGFFGATIFCLIPGYE